MEDKEHENKSMEGGNKKKDLCQCAGSRGGKVRSFTEREIKKEKKTSTNNKEKISQVNMHVIHMHILLDSETYGGRYMCCRHGFTVCCRMLRR